MHSHLHLDTRASISAQPSPSPNLWHIVRYRAAIDQNSGGQFVEGFGPFSVAWSQFPALKPQIDAIPEHWPAKSFPFAPSESALEARRKRILLKLAQSAAATHPDTLDVLLVTHDGVFGFLAQGITVGMGNVDDSEAGEGFGDELQLIL
jgi:hypothetical protein